MAIASSRWKTRNLEEDGGPEASKLEHDIGRAATISPIYIVMGWETIPERLASDYNDENGARAVEEARPVCVIMKKIMIFRRPKRYRLIENAGHEKEIILGLLGRTH
ncbi:unnamed protein product [Gongylonema pulchrum]|uniref:Protein kinase domain-containing protein n=1 Tax=Gongylonema pulchrum TaxID=637853 RepID=A0A183DGT8_9BILA|nr:unnamed protein product [Gongylonema pulchrum]